MLRRVGSGGQEAISPRESFECKAKHAASPIIELSSMTLYGNPLESFIFSVWQIWCHSKFPCLDPEIVSLKGRKGESR